MSKVNACQPTARRKPTWKEYHRLGVETSKQLESKYTYEDIGRMLGLTKQKVYHEAMVALGKIVYQLKKHYLGNVHQKTEMIS